MDEQQQAIDASLDNCEEADIVEEEEVFELGGDEEELPFLDGEQSPTNPRDLRPSKDEPLDVRHEEEVIDNGDGVRIHKKKTIRPPKRIGLDDLDMEEQREWRCCMRELRKLFRRFPDELQDFSLESVQQCYDIDVVRRYLDEIYETLCDVDSEQTLKGLYFKGIDVIEQLGCQQGWHLEGISRRLQGHKPTMKKLDLACIKYCSYAAMDPLASLAVSTGLVMHTYHKYNAEIAKRMSNTSSVPQDIIDEYEDL
jgi:hypothetical protein